MPAPAPPTSPVQIRLSVAALAELEALAAELKLSKSMCASLLLSLALQNDRIRAVFAALSDGRGTP